MITTLLTFALAAGLVPGADDPRTLVQVRALDERDVVPLRVDDVSSDHWIGVMCEPVDPLVRIHLRLAGGLVIRQVVAESPAAKAGLQENDILVRLDDSDILDVPTLIRVIDQAKARKITLVVLRTGERQTVEVVPAKRPEEAQNAVLQALEDAGVHHKHLEEQLKELEQGFRAPNAETSRRGRMLFVKPGVVVPGDLLDATEFPNNLEVSISKKGDGPAQIVVRRDDESWEINENELDKLPEDIRPFVRKFLSGNASFKFGWSNEPKALFLPDGESFKLRIPDLKMPELPTEEFRRKLESKLESKLERPRLRATVETVDKETVEQLRREIEALKKEVQRLREKSGP